MLLLFSCWVGSNSLWPHGSQHTRFPCASLSPGVCSNSCPLSQWCYLNHLILCHPLLLLPSIFPSITLFSLSQLFTSSGQSIGAQHQSFQWIFRVEFRVDFLLYCLMSSPCCWRDSQESSLALQFESFNSSALNLNYGPILTSIHDYWKNHSFDYMNICQQSDISTF